MVGLVVAVTAVVVAAHMPGQLCRYHGDVGECGSNPVRVIVALGGIAIGVGLTIWAIRGKQPSHWESRRSARGLTEY
jgi:hypothetical protein